MHCPCTEDFWDISKQMLDQSKYAWGRGRVKEWELEKRIINIVLNSTYDLIKYPYSMKVCKLGRQIHKLNIPISSIYWNVH